MSIAERAYEAVLAEELEDRAKAKREADLDAYIDWHYEQFGCAPTTGFGPAPTFAGGEMP